MKKGTLKLISSAVMLVITAVLLVGVTFAWFATNRNVDGNVGNTDIAYDANGGSADFKPGDGFGDEHPTTLFAGDFTEYTFSLRNETANEKNYVFRFNTLSVTYPTADVIEKKNYKNAVTVDRDYEYKVGEEWVRYDGMKNATFEQKEAFYKKFVTPMTNAVKVAVVENDGTTSLTDLVAETTNFVHLSSVSSYFDRNDDTEFYGASDILDHEVTNTHLATNFGMTVAGNSEKSYRMIVVYDGETFATATVDGVEYRMMNSNAFMWQSLSATVVVKEV